MGRARIDRAYLLYRGGAALFRALPRRVALAVGAAGGRLVARRAGAQYAVVRANLAQVVANTDGAAVDSLTLEAFEEYGRYWAATARLRPRDGARIDRVVRVEGMEHFRLWQEAPVIYALPHLGAWEVGGFWSTQQGLRLATVAEPASSERLCEFFTAARTAMGLRVVPLGPSTASELLGALDQGESVALVCDRDLTGDGIEVPFFGMPTRVPGGPALLALRSGARVVPTGTYLEADGTVRVVFCPPLDTARTGRLRDDVVRVTSDLVAAFESLIAAAPAQWHVFQPYWDEASCAREVEAVRS